jgi:hypothetical protein
LLPEHSLVKISRLLLLILVHSQISRLYIMYRARALGGVDQEALQVVPVEVLARVGFPAGGDMFMADEIPERTDRLEGVGDVCQAAVLRGGE